MSSVNSISNRQSLRAPQKKSLEILHDVCNLIRLEKGADVQEALLKIKESYPQVEDFEREFPSLCFALATGVGKTRLMGAFITYLYTERKIRHFFVLAPNLTIYEKLKADFSVGSPKYVFQGIPEFAITPPLVITGEDYETGRGVREEAQKQVRMTGMFDTGEVHVNIFNISKINSEVRGGAEPRIKRLQEYIGQSYFDYLAGLKDLVLIMDEAHRYRASAGVRAINELKPILGLELTATPQVEKGGAQQKFKNVIYNYPLGKAMDDGFVKEPAVATRKDFNPDNYDQNGLERLKLEDGVRIHEETKVKLSVFAGQTGKPKVKPFMLVVAKDTGHANELVTLMSDDGFFEGRYKGRVITVHSGQSGEEKDETIAQLLAVEDPNNETEIVVHVNMLKEGWDVTNLYTIVPLRTANSKTLVEQSIGRGLRLPYGKRTGDKDVDRLTIVAHDRFQEIVDEARRGDSLIRATVIVGEDIPERRSVEVVIPSKLDQILGIAQATPLPQQQGLQLQPIEPLFKDEKSIEAARITTQVIREISRHSSLQELTKKEVVQKIQQEVEQRIAPNQGEIAGTETKIDVGLIVRQVVTATTELTFSIPRIAIGPKGDSRPQFHKFNLDLKSVHYQPVEEKILIQHLHDDERYTLMAEGGVVEQKRLEDHVVSSLISFDDISYDENAELLYDLAGQVVSHFRSYLKDDDEIKNVLQYYSDPLAKLVHAQMQDHFGGPEDEYEAVVTSNFEEITAVHGTVPWNETLRDFMTPVDTKAEIRRMIFAGFKKCIFNHIKFDCDKERVLSQIIDGDDETLKWFKPTTKHIKIDYSSGKEYEPDFVVEAKDTCLVIECKQAGREDDKEVSAKANAAIEWCKYASAVSPKPWKYVLVPDDQITLSMSLGALTRNFAQS